MNKTGIEWATMTVTFSLSNGEIVGSRNGVA